MDNVISNVDWKNLVLEDFMRLIPDEKAAFSFAINSGLIDRVSRCECGSRMFLHERSYERHGFMFVCSAGKAYCRKTKSALAGSWFFRSNVGVRGGLLSILCYAAGFSMEQFRFITGIGSAQSSVDWNSDFRILCTEIVQNEEIVQIGGPSLTVEVDETLLFKRKNHTGRLLDSEARHYWMFGGICRETGETFVIPVSNRSQETLHAEIQRRIAPGTTIISDSWRGYCGLGNLDYTHKIINHTENFIHPVDPSINTQRIERLWRTLKNTIPKGAHWTTRWDYISVFQFKQRYNWYNLTVGERLKLLIEKIALVHFQ